MFSRSARVRSLRSASRRLTLRFIAERPGQTILVCIVCTIAIATGVIAHAYATDATERLELVGERRHGPVSVIVAGERDDERDMAAPSLPAVSHAPGRRLIWFSETLARRIEQAARTAGTTLLRRIEIAAYDSTGTIRTVLAVGPDDPGLELIATEQDLPRLDRGDAGTGVVRGNASAPLDLTVAIARRSDEPVEWRAIPAEAVHGTSRDGTVWVRYSWARSFIGDHSGGDAGEGQSDDPESTVGASPVANVLVAAAPIVAPFSVAYDLARRLEDAGAPTRVFAWPELVGYERYVGTGSAASLLRPLALAVAAVGVVGAVAVATRNRARDAVLLRTIGFDAGVIRSVYARETAVASIAAASLVLLGLFIASRFGVSVRIDAQVRRTLIGGALIPPMVAFLTVHRHVRAPLVRARREIDQ